MTAYLAPVFTEHRSFLWALSYRLTGNAADADDIVQDTFVRALRRPPADRNRPWRPWLVRVAVNLGRDLLRRRRRRGGYEGQWLPSPIETEPPSHEPADEGRSPAARYDLLESVSFAFLLALEALTPMQRATLLLRDVFDYSAREAARALGISEASARTTHLRARRALAAYDARRRPLTAEVQRREAAALQRFLACVTAGDVAEWRPAGRGARAVSDSGGEFIPTVPWSAGSRWRRPRGRREGDRAPAPSGAASPQRHPAVIGSASRRRDGAYLQSISTTWPDHGSYTVLATRKLSAIA